MREIELRAKAKKRILPEDEYEEIQDIPELKENLRTRLASTGCI